MCRPTHLTSGTPTRHHFSVAITHALYTPFLSIFSYKCLTSVQLHLPTSCVKFECTRRPQPVKTNPTHTCDKTLCLQYPVSYTRCTFRPSDFSASLCLKLLRIYPSRSPSTSTTDELELNCTLASTKYWRVYDRQRQLASSRPDDPPNLP